MKVEGIVPLRALSYSINDVTAERLPRESGIDPVKKFACRSSPAVVKE